MYMKNAKKSQWSNQRFILKITDFASLDQNTEENRAEKIYVRSCIGYVRCVQDRVRVEFILCIASKLLTIFSLVLRIQPIGAQAINQAVIS